MAHDVFISYSADDKAIADAIANALETRGIRGWIAPRDILPGEDWGSALVRAIEHARVMVLVFSAHANASRQVRREVQLAFEKDLTVIPFRVEDVHPTEGLKYYLQPVHWLDALTPPLAQHIKLLADRIQSYLDILSGGRAPAVADPSPAPSPVPLASMAAPVPAPKAVEAEARPVAPEAVIADVAETAVPRAFVTGTRPEGPPIVVGPIADAPRPDPLPADEDVPRGRQRRAPLLAAGATLGVILLGVAVIAVLNGRGQPEMPISAPMPSPSPALVASHKGEESTEAPRPGPLAPARAPSIEAPPAPSSAILVEPPPAPASTKLVEPPPAPPPTTVETVPAPPTPGEIADSLITKGDAHREKHELDAAIADYTEAIRCNRGDPRAYIRRARVYGDQRLNEKAVDDDSEAIRLKADDSSVYTERAYYYSRLMLHDKAIADCTEAIRLNANYAHAYFMRGCAYKDKGDSDRAITDFTEAIRLEPKNPYSYSLRGYTYEAKGESEKAQADHKKADELDQKKD